VRWIGSVETMEAAKALTQAPVQGLAAQNPGECFFVFDAQLSSVIFETRVETSVPPQD